jgi:DNA topoisomerase-1
MPRKKKTETESSGEKEGYELIITEKPQAAMKIAYALADIAPVRRDLNKVSYYEIIHDNKKIVVVCAVGHLFNLIGKGKGWPIFEMEWRPAYEKKGAEYTKRYADLIARMARSATSFTIATDYDIEGELIGWNSLRFLAKKEDARRMKFSTLTKEDISDAYGHAMPHLDWGQAYAGETRHYLDWLYGINLSRALMDAIKKAGSFKILSIGRVQGPALALIVKKEREIRKFKPRPYWQVALLISNSHDIIVKYPKDIQKKGELEKFKELKGKEGEAKTEKKNENIQPPAPFDLTTLQVEAYRLFGISPVNLLEITQQLYLAGLISYPRTSSQKLPPSIGYKKILEKLGRITELVKFARREKPVEGKKSDPAHPAIYPTGEKNEKLNEEQRKIYELIVKRFISCFSNDAIIENKSIKVKAKNFEFSARGVRIIEKGWLDVYSARIEEKIIPDVNGKIKIKEVKTEQKETQPPHRYTAASLVSELAKKDLGTKSTRATIIETLFNRGYLKGKSIEATSLGMSVISALEKNCSLILDENLTRNFEKGMDAIQISKKNIEEEKRIISEAKKIIEKISAVFKENEDAIGKELLTSINEIRKQEREDAVIMKCPKCGKGNLVIRKNKFGQQFVGCSAYPECKNTLSLPKYGLIKKSEKNCGCGWPLLLLIRKSRRPWQFCFNPACNSKIKGAEVESEKSEAEAKEVEAKKTEESGG